MSFAYSIIRSIFGHQQMQRRASMLLLIEAYGSVNACGVLYFLVHRYQVEGTNGALVSQPKDTSKVGLTTLFLNDTRWTSSQVFSVDPADTQSAQLPRPWRKTKSYVDRQLQEKDEVHEI